MNKVCVIGVGPGAEEYLLPIVRKEIERADCLIGAKRLLSLFQDQNKENVYLEDNFKEVTSYIKENKDRKKIAVLVSGDPGLHSFLGNIQRFLKKEEYVVIPGISTLQVAFARIGENWQNTKILSIHGRKLTNLAKEIKENNKVFLFTDSEFPPQDVALYLLNEGIDNRRAIVFENLTYPNERIVDTDIKNLSKMKGFGLCVMVIKK